MSKCFKSSCILETTSFHASPRSFERLELVASQLVATSTIPVQGPDTCHVVRLKAKTHVLRSFSATSPPSCCSSLPLYGLSVARDSCILTLVLVLNIMDILRVEINLRSISSSINTERHPSSVFRKRSSSLVIIALCTPPSMIYQGFSTHRGA